MHEEEEGREKNHNHLMQILPWILPVEQRTTSNISFLSHHNAEWVLS